MEKKLVELFTEEDVKESLEEVGIKLVPQSEEGKVKMTSEDGETVYLGEDFSMFDSPYLKRDNGVIDVTTKLFRHPKCLKHKDENATPYNDAHALVIKINDYEVYVIFEGTDKYYTFIPETEGWIRKALDNVANCNAEIIFLDDSVTKKDTPNRFETVWEALPFEEKEAIEKRFK